MRRVLLAVLALACVAQGVRAATPHSGRRAHLRAEMAQVESAIRLVQARQSRIPPAASPGISRVSTSGAYELQCLKARKTRLQALVGP